MFLGINCWLANVLDGFNDAEMIQTTGKIAKEMEISATTRRKIHNSRRCTFPLPVFFGFFVQLDIFRNLLPHARKPEIE